ncbi:MAG: hypothetical protein JXR68_11470 [Bacteroidales bacterium]|nr:hypothetical protein [Bacteroidales bacterium]
MKKIAILTFIFSIFFMLSCQEENDVSNNEDSSFVSQSYPTIGTFYATSDESIVVANPIIYDVIVKNTDQTDDWAEFCLANTDVEAICNIIYNAVYQEKLIAYHYLNDSIFSIAQVKEIEKENTPDKLGKIQFEEEWYFDETNLTMSKKVLSIIIGYEIKNDQGEVYGYKPGFKVYLDNDHNLVTR